MILSARQCGCPVHKNSNQQLQQASSYSSFSSSSGLNSCSSSLSSSECSKKQASCGCGGSLNEEDDESKPTIVSEIANKGQPYKEIETIFNNSRVIVRLQNEKTKPELEPPCDCIEDEDSCSNPNRSRSDITFQKVGDGCKTISVYPNPDPKNPSTESTAKNNEVVFPTVNPEENPNIFVLRIRRKCEKHNLDLEFKSPRPWSKKKCPEKKSLKF